MNQSENINELAGALAKAQGEMQAAIKDCINPFYKSKYADLGSVWDAARPVLSKNGLCVLQSTEMIADKIVMVTTLAHASGQWIKSLLPLNPSKNDSQGVGAAITYLRRYSLSALVGVVCDDDDDGETDAGRGKAKQTPILPIREPVFVSKEQVQKINEGYLSLPENYHSGFMKWCDTTFKTKNFSDIPEHGFEKCIERVASTLKYIKDQKVA